MIREIETKLYNEDLRYVKLVGLSSDSIPTEGLVTGSEFLAVDTSVKSYYDEMAGEWNPTTNASKTPLTGATVMLGSSLVYDGTEKTQSVSSVKIGSTTLTVNTDYVVKNNKATLPGTYTLLIVGRGSYVGVLQEEFTIGKASGSVTASPDELTLTEGGDPGTSTLTVVGDGAVSVASADPDVATVELEDDTVTVTPVAAGSTTVTVTLADGDLYEGGTDTISVTVEAAPEPEPGD